jgi:hypothetical protein
VTAVTEHEVHAPVQIFSLQESPVQLVHHDERSALLPVNAVVVHSVSTPGSVRVQQRTRTGQVFTLDFATNRWLQGSFASYNPASIAQEAM